MTSNEPMADLPGTPEAPVWQPLLDDDDSDAATPTAVAAGLAEAADLAPADSEMAPAEAASTDVPAGLAEAPAADRIQRRSPSRAPARRSGSTTAMLMLSALVALGGVGFAVGRATSTGSSTGNQTNNGAPAGSFFPGQFRPDASGAPDFRGGAGSTTVTGTVESVSSDSMTVRLADGQTVTIALGSSTTYHGQTSAISSQVTTGSTVVVQTTAGSASASASASPGTGSTNRTATDVTITSN